MEEREGDVDREERGGAAMTVCGERGAVTVEEREGAVGDCKERETTKRMLGKQEREGSLVRLDIVPSKNSMQSLLKG